MILDMDVSWSPAPALSHSSPQAGSLSFSASGVYLGPAFSGLPRHTALFPIISTVWGNCQVLNPAMLQPEPCALHQHLIPWSCQVSLSYVGGLDSCPLSLQQLARETIRKALAGWVVDDDALAIMRENIDIDPTQEEAGLAGPAHQAPQVPLLQGLGGQDEEDPGAV